MIDFLQRILELFSRKPCRHDLSLIKEELAHQESEPKRLVITPDLQVYEPAVQVAGTHVRINDVLRFHDSSGQKLVLEPEPSNPHDENAIRVMGHCRSGKLFLGYVPAYVAKHIAAKKMLGVITPRLVSVRVTQDRRYVDVMFDLLGPVDRYAEFYPPPKRKRTRKTK